MRRRFWDGVLLISLALTGAAEAQTTDQPPTPQALEAGRVAYDAAFYAQFSPRTALDMINQTPGFVLIEGGERRGFSGAVGNVLVDGERPTAKSQTLADVLQRIPAGQVLRIEILRGAEAAGDASGQSALANVVRTPSAGQGVWSLGAEYAAQHQAAPNGWASWSGRAGTTDYGLGASGYSLLRELPGARDVRDSEGELLATRQEASPRHFYETALNGEASRNAFGGRVRVTGQAYYSRYHEDSNILTFSPTGARLEDEFNPYTESKTTFEAGANYDRSLGPWDLALVSLLTRSDFESDVSSTHNDAGGDIDSVFRQALQRESGESILRGTLARDFSAGRLLEVGFEGAFNTLDAALALTLDLGGGPSNIPVPNSNLAVEETRGEAFLAYTRRIDARWSLEARLAGETSRLSFTGDADQSTELSYFKPSLQVTRTIGAHNQVRMRIYRDVSQLDFNDFVSAASLSDDIIEGGNPDLRPETSWRAEIAADLRFGAQGALGVTLFHHRIEDAADLVPVGAPGEEVDAPGNIGEASISGVTLTLRAPLTPLIPGGVFTLDTTLREAEVTDPLTGEHRTISNFEGTQLKAGFRQDVPAWRLAWGVDYAGQSQRVGYRLREIDTRRDSPSLDAFIETTALPNIKLRLTAVSLFDEPEQRERIFLAPSRTGAVDHIEQSERSPGSWLLLSASGAF